MTQNGGDLPIEMGRFFDGVASTYDAHRAQITSYDLDSLFAAVAGAIDETSGEVTILDLGAGTGAELEWMLARAPNARIACIDMSGGMLAELRRKYADSLGQIEVVNGSFLDVPFQNGHYQYVVSVQSMHHLRYEQRLDLYRRIREALALNGKYIEGDHVLPSDEERERSAWYRRQIEAGSVSPDGMYHIDIPFSVATQKKVLLEAGFTRVEVLHEQEYAAVLSAR